MLLFSSGKWCGYFVDPRHGVGHDADPKWHMDIVVSFRCDDTFVAFGVDEVGTFELKNGKIIGMVILHFNEQGCFFLLCLRMP